MLALSIELCRSAFLFLFLFRTHHRSIARLIACVASSCVCSLARYSFICSSPRTRLFVVVMQVVRVLCIVALLAVAVTASGIEVRSASRTLSLTSSLAKETTEFVYHNSGSSSISTAEIAVLGENLAYLVVSRDGKELVATYARDHMHNGVTYVARTHSSSPCSLGTHTHTTN